MNQSPNLCPSFCFKGKNKKEKLNVNYDSTIFIKEQKGWFHAVLLDILVGVTHVLVTFTLWSPEQLGNYTLMFTECNVYFAWKLNNQSFDCR